jgi:arsenate reductase
LIARGKWSENSRREKTMERITLYHNPACGNSRGALELLRTRDVDFDIVEYLKNHPTR